MTFRSRNLFLFSIVSISFLSLGNYFISDSFAVNFQDSSGYTPSWAQNSEYHAVFLKCDEFTGSNSKDEKWCMEWVVYVLDQGVENFPESTSSITPPSKVYNLSERICDANKICAFPGDYLKYKISDSFDNFSEIGVIEFKEKINDNAINFFLDGWGMKPLTYTLDLKTGMEKNSQYDANRPFQEIEQIPMEIGQKVSEWLEGYYDATITTERTVNLKDLGLMDVTRTLMMAKTDYDNGDSLILVYDKETGVLISNISKYEKDGKKYTSGTVLIDTNIFLVPTKIRSVPTNIPSVPTKITPKEPLIAKNVISRSIDGVMSDEESCIAMIKGAKWDPTDNRCITSSFTINSGETLTISSDVRLRNSFGVITNNGTINVLGELNNSGAIENFGTINVSGYFENNGRLYNNGIIIINTSGKISNSGIAAMNNFGTISNNHQLTNYGKINNYCNAVISGNPVVNSSGDNQINNISCIASKKVQKTEIETSQELEKIQQTETIPSQESELPDWAKAILGFLVLVGILAIIIGPIVWKIKQKKSKERKLREKEWKGI